MSNENSDHRRVFVFGLTEYQPKGSDEWKTRWTKIGVAFENDDGKDGAPGSVTGVLDAYPVSGRIQLRWETDTEIEERKQREEERRRENESRSHGRRGGRR